MSPIQAFSENRRFWSAAPAALPATTAELSNLLHKARESTAYYKDRAAQTLADAYLLTGIVEGRVTNVDGAESQLKRLLGTYSVPGWVKSGYECPSGEIDSYLSREARQKHRASFRIRIRSYRTLMKTRNLAAWVSGEHKASAARRAMYEELQDQLVKEMALVERNRTQDLEAGQKRKADNAGPGYLGLIVDNENKKIRREGHFATVDLRNKLALWETFCVFFAAEANDASEDAWRAGTSGEWDSRRMTRNNLKNELICLGITIPDGGRRLADDGTTIA